MRMQIVIFGGTGFIGQPLVRALQAAGHNVLVTDLRRDTEWETKLAGSDAVVNLAGAPLFSKRWTESFKKEIYDSRIDGTRKIVDAIGRAKQKGGGPRVLVSASAVGYYGPHPSAEFTESSGPGDDFLAKVCRDWEAEALRAEREFGVRTVLVRTGVVLGREGGALKQLLLPFKMFVGGPVASGQQWFPWISLDDIVGIYRHAVENTSVRGPLNGAAPGIVNNEDFSRALGHVLHRPSLLRVPAFALYALVGGSAEVVVEGQKVRPQATLASGYVFRDPELTPALKKILA